MHINRRGLLFVAVGVAVGFLVLVVWFEPDGLLLNFILWLVAGLLDLVYRAIRSFRYSFRGVFESSRAGGMIFGLPVYILLVYPVLCILLMRL